LRSGKDKFSLSKGAILGRFGELGSAGAKSLDDRLYGIEHAEVGEVVAGELMSIASSLELARKAEDIGGRGFCLPYPGVAKDETCGLPVGTTRYNP
jgi:hypothetical protein